MWHFLRVVNSTMKATLISQWRFFSWSGLVLRSFPALFNLGVGWVLYNTMFDGRTLPDFVEATGSSDYFSFILVGSIFFVYVVSSLFSLGRAMLWERAQGTLEALFLSPISHVAYMLGVAIAAFGMSTMDFITLLLIGYILGFRVQHINVVWLMIGLMLMFFALFGLGLIVNAITLTFRDRTNTANTLTLILLVFSGIVCPTRLMPQWAQVISKVVPFSYGLDILRNALIHKTDYFNMISYIFNMIFLASFFVVIGMISLRRIEKNSKKNASLTAF